MPNFRTPQNRFVLLWLAAQIAAVVGVLGTDSLRTPGAAWIALAGYALAALLVLWIGRVMLRGDAPPAWLVPWQERTARFALPLLIGAGLSLLWLWADGFLAGRGETLAALLRFGGTGLVAVGLYALLGWGRDVAISRRAVLGLAVAALLLAILLPLLFVSDFPRLDDTDEPWNINVGWTVAETGQLYARMYRDANGIPNPLLPAGNYLLAAWLKALGLGLVQARLYQAAWKLLLLLLVFDTTRRLYDRPSAILATLFAALFAVLFEFGLLVRGDVPLAATVALAFWLHVLARQRVARQNASERRANALHLLSGLVLALSIQIHQNGLVFALAFGAAYTLDYAGLLRRERRFVLDRRWLAFALGGLLGALAFVLAPQQPLRAFAPEYQGYTGQSGYFFPITSLDPGVMLGIEGARLLRYGGGAPFDLALLLLAVLAAWWRGDESDRRLLGLLGLVALGYLAIVSSDSSFYLIHPLALFAPLAGALLWHLTPSLPLSMHREGEDTSQPAARRGQVITAIILIGVIGAMLGTDLGRFIATLNEGHNRRFFACAQESADLFPPEAVLYFDEPVLWLAYLDAEDYADHHLLDIWAATRGLTPAESMAEIAPDVTLGMYGGRPEGVAYAEAHGYVRLDADNGGVACWTMWVNPAVLDETQFPHVFQQILPFNPPDCVLPCVLGITPGQTTYAEARQIRDALGELYPPGTAFPDAIQTAQNGEITIDLTYSRPSVDDTVQRISLFAESGNRLTTLGELLDSGHTLRQVFRNRVAGPDAVTLLLVLDYRKQIVAVVVGIDDVGPNSDVVGITAISEKEPYWLHELRSRRHFDDEIPWLGYAPVAAYWDAEPSE